MIDMEGSVETAEQTLTIFAPVIGALDVIACCTQLPL